MTSPSDNLQDYTVYGVCAAEVELDVLTGSHQLRRVDLLEDTGISISPDIDVGQLLTNRTWTYKPPGAKDIPADFRVSFRRNSPNPAGVLRSKATGEPAFVLAIVVTFALHDAILDARKEFDSPYNVEHILKAVATKTEYFKIK
ncbi:Aldehyde oxidase, partial [Operophtera brumata]